LEKRIPKPGEIYNHFKDKLYQIITVATHTETGEKMVVYQALYGDFQFYVRPLEMFLSKVDTEKYPEIKQLNRFELQTNREQTEKLRSMDKEIPIHNVEDAQKTLLCPSGNMQHSIETVPLREQEITLQETDIPQNNAQEGSVNSILLDFLDATSYTRKLNVITGNMKHMTDRLINDMAVSLDCSVEEGPLEKRIQELIFCLKAMCRFEDRRLR
jgi:hypothetical protein